MRQFLNKYKTRGSITSLIALESLLVGWSCSPSARTQDLLDSIYGEEEPEIDDFEELEKFIRVLFSFQNLSIKELSKKTYKPFFFKEEKDIQLWCQYFTWGIGEEVFYQEDLPVEIRLILMCIEAKGFPQDRDMLEGDKKEFERIQKAVESWGVRDFANIAQALYLFFCEQRAKKHGGTKKALGRNEPCICGSGKKFKHCCLQ